MFELIRRFIETPLEDRLLEKYASKVFVPSLTKEEEQDILHYTRNDYTYINKCLRDGRKVNGNVIKNIDIALSKFNYGEPIVVYRKLMFNNPNEFDDFNKVLHKNNGYQDKAYTSTSLTIDTRFDYNVLLCISIDRNCYAGAYIKALSFTESEKEYLIKRNIFMEYIKEYYYQEEGEVKEIVFLKIK